MIDTIGELVPLARVETIIGNNISTTAFTPEVVVILQGHIYILCIFYLNVVTEDKDAVTGLMLTITVLLTSGGE